MDATRNNHTKWSKSERERQTPYISYMWDLSESHSVVSNSLWPHALYSPWNSPGQNTGVGSLSLLQWIFLTQESNWGLLHCRRILYQLSYQGHKWTFMKQKQIHRHREQTCGCQGGGKSGRGTDWEFETAVAAKSLQLCQTEAHQALPSLGFSRQEHWSGLPFPPPMHESEKWKWSHSVVSNSSVIPWTAAHQAPPSMGFSRQEYWSGVPLPSLSLRLADVNYYTQNG